MGLRSEQKQRTRRRLVETALNLSATEGFGALSIREVSKQAGITPAAFYRHFSDLESLGLSLIDEIGISLRQLLREARNRSGLQKDVVRSSIETFLAYVADNPNLFRLLLGERQGCFTEFRKAIHAEMDRFIAELTEDLEKGAQIINRPIEAALAAEAIVAAVFTVGAEALDLPKHRRLELVERLIKVVRIILRGAGIEKNAPHLNIKGYKIY